jgi:hypothetical protein
MLVHTRLFLAAIGGGVFKTGNSWNEKGRNSKIKAALRALNGGPWLENAKGSVARLTFIRPFLNILYGHYLTHLHF